MTAMDYTASPDLAARIQRDLYTDRDRRNEIDRLAMQSGAPAAKRGDWRGYVVEVMGRGE